MSLSHTRWIPMVAIALAAALVSCSPQLQKSEKAAWLETEGKIIRVTHEYQEAGFKDQTFEFKGPGVSESYKTDLQFLQIDVEQEALYRFLGIELVREGGDERRSVVVESVQDDGTRYRFIGTAPMIKSGSTMHVGYPFELGVVINDDNIGSVTVDTRLEKKSTIHQIRFKTDSADLTIEREDFGNLKVYAFHSDSEQVGYLETTGAAFKRTGSFFVDPKLDERILHACLILLTASESRVLNGPQS